MATTSAVSYQDVPEDQPIRAWHFIAADRLMLYPPHNPIVAGETYYVRGPLEICHRGLHAAINPLDALHYAPGLTVSRVEMFGQCYFQADKMVAENRRVLWIADATKTMVDFLIDVAERAQVMWDSIEDASEKLRWEFLMYSITKRARMNAWPSAFSADTRLLDIREGIDEALDLSFFVHNSYPKSGGFNADRQFSPLFKELTTDLTVALEALAPKEKD